ncbi:MAG: hypothetical protein E7536_06465 [Ruminococcaceae bacterium]|nr:hypothetical protein [Oscillospiraceae bacterium]MBE6783638.1 hypothetical protein [Oscillospiraceae bacterium]
MSENKRYYWYKMKTDFFDEMIIKFLKLQENGETMILTFQRIMLYSLKTDGYLYYKKMLPTFAEELALGIGEKADLVKKLLDILITYDAIEKIDETTYFITMIEDCVGSETSVASRVRKHRNSEKSNEEALQSNTETLQCNAKVLHCNTEKEKEKEKRESKRKEEKNTSAFSFQKKSGSVNVQNENFQKNSAEVQHNSAACANPPRNYEMEEFLKKNNQTLSDYMPKACL